MAILKFENEDSIITNPRILFNFKISSFSNSYYDLLHYQSITFIGNNRGNIRNFETKHHDWKYTGIHPVGLITGFCVDVYRHKRHRKNC